CRVVEPSTIQQERLQAIAEKRKRQTEIENKRRQLEDDRRQLQHLKTGFGQHVWEWDGDGAALSQAIEQGHGEGQGPLLSTLRHPSAPSPRRLEKELETLENGSSAASTKDNLVEAAAPAKEEKTESIPNTQKVGMGWGPLPWWAGEGQGHHNAHCPLCVPAMYSVEITVEKDRVTGETKVLSSTTMLPQNHCLQGVKVYEDELKVVHAVSAEDGALQNGAHALSSSEVDELLHKADEATLSETSGREGPARAGEETGSPRESTAGEGMEPSREQPVTMIFMGYQNVEDENETKKVLGLEGTIKAELVVIEDAENKLEPAHKDHAPPNGTALEPAATQPTGEEGPGGQKPCANATDTKEAEQEMDVKKQRCKCCTVM
ncbi:PALM protein, partial [Chloroceryle aenea]|nr:PALM protein [Chloroceryle aenea]